MIAIFAMMAALIPGTYDSSEGDLKLTKGAKGVLSFAISTASPSGDMCEADGDLDDAGTGKVKGEDGCVLKLEQKSGRVAVSIIGKGCSGLCGQSASIEGDFLLADPACAPKALDQAEKDFEKTYKAKNYAGAATGLGQVFKACSDRLNLARANVLMNDLAIADFHLGKLDECIALSKKVEATAPEEAPRMRELYADDAKHAAFNRKKCEAARKSN